MTPKGDKVREIGPIVYGYSVVVGPDGKPRITEFGNVKQGTHIGSKEVPEEEGEDRDLQLKESL